MKESLNSASQPAGAFRSYLSPVSVPMDLAMFLPCVCVCACVQPCHFVILEEERQGFVDSGAVG